MTMETPLNSCPKTKNIETHGFGDPLFYETHDPVDPSGRWSIWDHLPISEGEKTVVGVTSEGKMGTYFEHV